MVTSERFESWKSGLADLFACYAGRFTRVEPRRYASAYVRGLLAPLERKNGRTLAEMAGFRCPNGLQDFLQSPAWKPDLVRDDVRDYAVEHLSEADGVNSFRVQLSQWAHQGHINKIGPALYAPACTS